MGEAMKATYIGMIELSIWKREDTEHGCRSTKIRRLVLKFPFVSEVKTCQRNQSAADPAASTRVAITGFQYGMKCLRALAIPAKSLARH